VEKKRITRIARGMNCKMLATLPTYWMPLSPMKAARMAQIEATAAWAAVP
jgi:hypothetical protein